MKKIPIFIDLEEADMLQTGLELYADGIKGIELAIEHKVEPDPNDPLPSPEELESIKKTLEKIHATLEALKEELVKDLEVKEEIIKPE